MNGECASLPQPRRRDQARAGRGRGQTGTTAATATGVSPVGDVGVRSAGRGRPQARWWSRGWVTADERSASCRRVNRDVAQRETREFGFTHRRRDDGAVRDTRVVHIAEGVLVPMLGARHLPRVLLLDTGPMLAFAIMLTVVRNAVRQRLAGVGDSGDGHEPGRKEAGDDRGAHWNGNVAGSQGCAMCSAPMG